MLTVQKRWTRLALVIGLSLAILGCTKGKPEKPSAEAGEIQIQQAIFNLASRYSAITSWAPNDKQPVYSLALWREMAAHGRPIVVTAQLDDVFISDGGKHFARFWNDDWSSSVPSMILTTEISAAQAEKLMGYPVEEYLSSFALIVKVKKITKALMAVNGYAASDEEVWVELENAETFLVSAELIDWEFFPEFTASLSRLFPR